MRRIAHGNLAAKAFVLIVLIFQLGQIAAEDARPRIAIIIDDLGYERVAGERAIALPGAMTFAVLPGAPYSKSLASLAHENGKGVLLHLPLQATSDAADEEPGSLVLDMSQQQFRTALAGNIEAVPHIIGINTHRGSLLTRHPGHMRWLMDEVLERGDLFFVDSFTTAQSVALRIALESGVPAIRRDVFLDPDTEPETITREFLRLEQLARERGVAVGIGHPYPGTLTFLERALPELEARGIDLVPVLSIVNDMNY